MCDLPQSIVGRVERCKRETIHRQAGAFGLFDQRLGGAERGFTPFFPGRPTGLSTAPEKCPTLQRYDIDLTRRVAAFQV
jgi:hypothetical protein